MSRPEDRSCCSNNCSQAALSEENTYSKLSDLTVTKNTTHQFSQSKSLSLECKLRTDIATASN